MGTSNYQAFRKGNGFCVQRWKFLVQNLQISPKTKARYNVKILIKLVIIASIFSETCPVPTWAEMLLRDIEAILKIFIFGHMCCGLMKLKWKCMDIMTIFTIGGKLRKLLTIQTEVRRWHHHVMGLFCWLFSYKFLTFQYQRKYGFIINWCKFMAFWLNIFKFSHNCKIKL